jgi:hypothetical protein
MEELARRIEGKEIGKNVVLLPVALMIEPPLSQVEKLLHVDKLKPFADRENEYEAADLKQVGLEKALETINAERALKSIPLPPYPLKLHPDIQNAWDRWMSEAWRQGMEKAFREIKAGLTLDDETIRQKSRDQIRELFKKTSRRDQVISLTSLADEDVTDGYSATTARIPAPHESKMEREIGADAYDYVINRYEEAGRRFLDALIANKGNIAAASNVAGFSRPTGHKIKKELQIRISKKFLSN